MEIVINTSPLIFLHGIEKLHLLNALYSKIYIPHAVLHEICDLDIGGLDYTILHASNTVAVASLLGKLHIGEVEVIISALENDIQTVVLDDNAARITAKQLGLDVTGTLGILREGRNKGIITDLASEVNKLQINGMYLSDQLAAEILK